MGKGEIVLYQPDNSVELEVRVEDETVWLNRQQMALFFERDVKTIGKHVNNALTQELRGFSVVAKFATTANDGKVYQVDYYNLDMILSVGYRVKSQRGIDFRRWANQVLKDYLLRGYAITQRVERLEQRVSQTEEKIDFFVRTSLPPVEGVVYEGQIFDAINSRQLQQDVESHNRQYFPIEMEVCTNIHDRFLIIDDTVYHIGASLKDLGKKLFAFSKMGIPPEKIIPTFAL
jgi:hypothetical protein